MYTILPTEKFVETKICRHCQASFPITDKDIEFYDKVSPVFNDKKYSIPTPTLCPDCRQQRRLSFRNERSLYHRKCDLTGKTIISIYSPDKPYTVYNKEDWWSDKWDPMDYGQDFDFSKGFFGQFDSLLKKVPHLNLTASFDSENSEYATFSWRMKDCYMVYAGWIMEKTLYSSRMINVNSVVDALDGTNLEQCYQVLNCEGCYWCMYCMNSNNCRNSSFLYDCENCSDCFLCYNLIGKKYHIENKEYSKEEYLKRVEVLKDEYFALWWQAFDGIKAKAINKNLMMINCENSIGDNLKNCNNCSNIFHFENSENCKYTENGWMSCNNTYDGIGVWENLDLAYEIVDAGINAMLTCFGITCYTCNYSYYNFNCHNSSNLFGCIGLRNKSYCILNKQYTKEEYEELVPRIIEHMKKTGEWGEFFPSSISPFGYNETIANEYYPLSRESALQHLYKWSDYENPRPQVTRTIPASKLPNDITKIPDDILNWAIECEVTGKPFRIVKQELEFYRKHNLPIPRRHPDQRHLDRVNMRNPRKFFERKCDKCSIDVITTCAPEKKETVYCESCYNKEVIG